MTEYELIIDGHVVHKEEFLRPLITELDHIAQFTEFSEATIRKVKV